MFSLYILSEFFSNVKNRCLGHEKVNVENINDFIYIFVYGIELIFISK